MSISHGFTLTPTLTRNSQRNGLIRRRRHPRWLVPFFLRSKGLGAAVFVQSVVAIVLSQVTPPALANVSWR